MGLTKKLVMAVLPLFSLMAVGEEVEPLYSKHDYIKGKVMILTNTEEWVAGKLSSVSGEIAAIWEEMSHLPTGEGLAKVAQDATNYTDAVAVETKGYADGQVATAATGATNYTDAVALQTKSYADGRDASVAQDATNYTDAVAIQTKGYADGIVQTASSDATNYTDSVALGIRADIPTNTTQLVNGNGYVTESITNDLARSEDIKALDNIEVGDGSPTNDYHVTIGKDATASVADTPPHNYKRGVAIGWGAEAGAAGIAIGEGAKTTASVGMVETNSQTAAAIGLQSEARGNAALAVGKQAKATARSSVAIGNSAQAGSEYALAIGAPRTTTAGGTVNVSVTNATGAIAIGSGATVSPTSGTANYSIAIGAGSSVKASGDGSVAIGFNSGANAGGVAVGINSAGPGVSVGSGAKAVTASAVAIGQGAQATRTKDPSWLTYPTAVGAGASTTGPSSSAFGAGAQATLSGALALGRFAKATGERAVAVGGHAVDGSAAIASGNDSIALGQGTAAANKFCVWGYEVMDKTTGKISLDRLPPIEAGLTTNDVSSIVSNITDGAFLATTGGVVTGKTTLDGLTEILDLTVTSDTSLQGDLTVIGNSDLGNTSISTLSISESATLASAEVSDNLTVSGTTYLEGTTYLNGRTYVEDTIRINGDMYLNDQKVDLNDYVSVNNGTATNLMVSNLTVAGNFAPTNGFVTSSVTNGLIGADAISTNNPAFVKAVTNCPIAVLNGEGKVPLDMLPPIDAGLKTNNVEDLIDENISTNNPSFVAAVTNCPVAVDPSYSDFAGYGTIGTLLAALVAAIALLRKKKADSETLADEFDATKAYSKEEYVTHDGKLYRFNAAHVAGAWTGTDVDEIQVTAPDATIDVGSDNRLRVVDAEANILWSQGYQLADESSATLSCDKVNLISLTDGTTTLSLTLPTVPTGVVGDFIVDIDNSQNTSDVAGEITDLTNTKISVVLMDGDDLNDLLTFTANTMYELYFTQTAFAIDGKPTWKVMRQVVVSGNPSTGS